MPGFFISNFKPNECDELSNYNTTNFRKNEISDECIVIKQNVLDSFKNDKIIFENEDAMIVTDGIIYNLQELKKTYNATDLSQLILILSKKGEDFFKYFSGHFSGAIYYKKTPKIVAYTNQLGDRAIYYYFDKQTKKFIVASQVNYIVDTLKKNKISRTIDNEGVNIFLDFGFFFDESTFIEEIKRLYPGTYIVIDSLNVEIKEYYKAEYEKKQTDIDTAIEQIDVAFDNSLRRIYNKAKENDYNCIVDISGGLDSRIISYASKKLKEENVVLLSYSQSGSNEEKIAKEIANNLKYDLYLKTLDNGKCLYDIDNLVFMNNGSAFYHGITGGFRFLEILNPRKYAIEITGLLGNVYDNSMITEMGDVRPDINYRKFIARKKGMLDNKYEEHEMLKRFSNNDLFWLYTRGIMAGMSTFMTRQNFIEPVTPFGDLEFLEAFLTIPWKDRIEKNILRNWLIRKYPEAAKIKYAATDFSILDENKPFFKQKMIANLYMKKLVTLLQKKPLPHNMNPINYWIQNDSNLERYIENYFYNNLNLMDVNQEIKNKMKYLFINNNEFIDKSIVLSFISFYLQFIK